VEANSELGNLNPTTEEFDSVPANQNPAVTTLNLVAVGLNPVMVEVVAAGRGQIS
jgi:hypothetical protein